MNVDFCWGHELSCLYETPAPQTVEPEDSGELVFSLNSYTAVPLSGNGSG